MIDFLPELEASLRNYLAKKSASEREPKAKPEDLLTEFFTHKTNSGNTRISGIRFSAKLNMIKASRTYKTV